MKTKLLLLCLLYGIVPAVAGQLDQFEKAAGGGKSGPAPSPTQPTSGDNDPLIPTRNNETCDGLFSCLLNGLIGSLFNSNQNNIVPTEEYKPKVEWRQIPQNADSTQSDTSLLASVPKEAKTRIKHPPIPQDTSGYLDQSFRIIVSLAKLRGHSKSQLSNMSTEFAFSYGSFVMGWESEYWVESDLQTQDTATLVEFHLPFTYGRYILNHKLKIQGGFSILKYDGNASSLGSSWGMGAQTRLHSRFYPFVKYWMGSLNPEYFLFPVPRIQSLSLGVDILPFGQDLPFVINPQTKLMYTQATLWWAAGLGLGFAF